SVSTYSRDNGVWSRSLIASGRSVTDNEIDIPISHIRTSGNTSANVTVSLSRENCLSSLLVCARIFFIISSFRLREATQLVAVSFAHFHHDRDKDVLERVGFFIRSRDLYSGSLELFAHSSDSSFNFFIHDHMQPIAEERDAPRFAIVLE